MGVFDSFKEFVNKIFKNLKFDKVTTPASEDQDSNLSPEYINFQRSKKNNSEKIKKNQEGLIPDEN